MKLSDKALGLLIALLVVYIVADFLNGVHEGMVAERVRKKAAEECKELGPGTWVYQSDRLYICVDGVLK